MLEEKNEEIISWRQRETANEDYTSRLARKLDRLMVENQNRAQKDLRERMNLLDDKNRLSVENGNLKRQLEELGARLKVDQFHPNPNHIPIINGEPVSTYSFSFQISRTTFGSTALYLGIPGYTRCKRRLV